MAGFTDELQRLNVLQLLEESPGYRASDVVVQQGLEATYAQVLGMQDVDRVIHWLGDAGAVMVKTVGGLLMAELTQLGLDLARGASTRPGIARPRPSR